MINVKEKLDKMKSKYETVKLSASNKLGTMPGNPKFNGYNTNMTNKILGGQSCVESRIFKKSLGSKKELGDD